MNWETLDTIESSVFHKRIKTNDFVRFNNGDAVGVAMNNEDDDGYFMILLQNTNDVVMMHHAEGRLYYVEKSSTRDGGIYSLYSDKCRNRRKYNHDENQGGLGGT